MTSGILREIKGDFVLVDSKWYKVLEPKYIPKGQDVSVEFETTPNDPGVIKFIKRAGGGSSSQKSYGNSNSSSGYSAKNNTSIVRQVIFKGAIELVNAGKFPDVASAMATLKELEAYLLGN